jgi:hypothetical protein
LAAAIDLAPVRDVGHDCVGGTFTSKDNPVIADSNTVTRRFTRHLSQIQTLILGGNSIEGCSDGVCDFVGQSIKLTKSVWRQANVHA